MFNYHDVFAAAVLAWCGAALRQGRLITIPRLSPLRLLQLPMPRQGRPRASMWALQQVRTMVSKTCCIFRQGVALRHCIARLREFSRIWRAQHAGARPSSPPAGVPASMSNLFFCSQRIIVTRRRSCCHLRVRDGVRACLSLMCVFCCDGGVQVPPWI